MDFECQHDHSPSKDKKFCRYASKSFLPARAMATITPKHRIVQMNRGTFENGLANCWQDRAAEYVLRMFLFGVRHHHTTQEVYDLHIDAGKHQKNQDELRKALRIQHIVDQVSQALVLIRILPVGAIVERRRDDTASHHSNAGRKSDSKSRHEKDSGSADIDSIVHVVIRGNGRPACRRSIHDGEKTQDAAAQVCSFQRRAGGVVSILSCLAKDDQENDEVY